ncbi:type I methionyl aminopeptidase [Flexilinea flocculi]|jgi:methionyl aminopeptidase|uniref:Methionine aminopeptidase n=1 Tax=Flexilinea flocculi TaxID=1678840 RepID=A0A0K8PBA9_9CHLR|nr:type I methionyl aminopeptidase [Flexilinea flocculi]NMB93295.1 type I methionyl aminopeptidase [Flexilinea flocculi]GAP39799.1 methionine aminopeptidase, type I [Flexilinea flocculi]
MSWERQVSIKSGEELKLMREAGKINAEALKAASEACVAGASTWDVNAAAERVLDSYHVISPFKGVPGPIPFPASTCVSVNHVLVHGIPSKKMILREGDIVSVDCGTIYQGFVADSAFTIGVGKISEEAQHLLEVTEESLYVGIQKMVSGNYTGDVSASIQQFVENHGLYVTKQYTGHGVGRRMWEAPQVPNYGTAGQGLLLKPGITIAIEPMVLIGSDATKVLSDGWAVSSERMSLTAHFEHTVAVTDNGPMITTLLENGEAPVSMKKRGVLS